MYWEAPAGGQRAERDLGGFGPRDSPSAPVLATLSAVLYLPLNLHLSLSPPSLVPEHHDHATALWLIWVLPWALCQSHYLGLNPSSVLY